jgi:site-specific recombinase XerD
MMTQGGLKAASINRRVEVVRRLLRWAEATGAVARNVALHVRSVRVVRERGPRGLTAGEVHGLPRAAEESSHGLARRNYALVQLMLQTGLRVGEVAALRRSDIVLRDRAGMVRVRNGKGLREREVPLNAMARRALRPAQALIFERTGQVASSHRGVNSQFNLLTRGDPRVDAELRRFLPL